VTALERYSDGAQRRSRWDVECRNRGRGMEQSVDIQGAPLSGPDLPTKWGGTRPGRSRRFDRVGYGARRTRPHQQIGDHKVSHASSDSRGIRRDRADGPENQQGKEARI
jgi:hypothetical protein